MLTILMSRYAWKINTSQVSSIWRARLQQCPIKYPAVKSNKENALMALLRNIVQQAR